MFTHIAPVSHTRYAISYSSSISKALIYTPLACLLLEIALCMTFPSDLHALVVYNFHMY